MREFRLASLAKSCECKGFSTLITNMVTTRCNNEEVIMMAKDEHEDGNEQLAQFVDGASHDLHRIPFSSSEEICKPNRTFGEINKDLYDQGTRLPNGQVCLIAVVEKDSAGQGVLKMNPGSDYKIKENCVAGVCIAASPPADSRPATVQANEVMIKALHHSSDMDKIGHRSNRLSSFTGTGTVLTLFSLSHHFDAAASPLLM